MRMKEKGNSYAIKRGGLKEKKIYVIVALFVSINASPSYLSKFAKFFLLNIEALSASLFLLIKEHLKMHINLQSPYLNEVVKASFWLTFLVCNLLDMFQD